MDGGVVKLSLNWKWHLHFTSCRVCLQQQIKSSQLSRTQDTTVEKKNQECQFRLLVMGVWNKQHGWPVVLLLGFVKHDAVGLVLKFKIGFTCF